MSKTETTATGTINNCPYCGAYTAPGDLPHLCVKQPVEDIKPDPTARRLDRRIEVLSEHQAIFCLKAMLAAGRVSQHDMEATLNFMEALNVG